MTVSEAGGLWLQRAHVEGLEESTVRQYRQHLRLHIEPLIGHHNVANLTPPMVEGFKDNLLQTRSRAISRKVLTSLKSVLKEAVRLGHAQHNAASTVQIRRTPRAAIAEWDGGSTTVKMPSKEEIRRVIAKSAQLFPVPCVPIEARDMSRHGKTCWYPFMLTAIFTGMRSSELRGLGWRHVDLERRIIRVRQRADFRNQLGPPKSAAGYRDIPMAPIVATTLAAWKAVCPPSPLNLVFPSRNGRIHTNSNIHKQCWGPVQLAAGITQPCNQSGDAQAARPRFAFHALRHAAASLFIDQRWPAKKVQAVMGHSSIQVTFDIYGKLWVDHERDLEAMALLEKSLLGSSQCPPDIGAQSRGDGRAMSASADVIDGNCDVRSAD